jgi:hypothetical protein
MGAVLGLPLGGPSEPSPTEAREAQFSNSLKLKYIIIGTKFGCFGLF